MDPSPLKIDNWKHILRQKSTKSEALHAMGNVKKYVCPSCPSLSHKKNSKLEATQKFATHEFSL